MWKRTRISLKEKQNVQARAIKQGDLERLEWAAAAGEICLKYLDESGFSLWANVTYSWAEKGKQKRIEQPKKKGKRLNICGCLEVGTSFEYGLALKSFKSKSYIKLIDWQAEQAQNRFNQTGQITVIIEDQASIHRSQSTQANYQRWQEKGLYIFFLPSYSSDLNRIENEWQRLKEDELAGRMFETEYDLAMALIEAIDSRAAKKGLQVERFHFNST